MSTINYIQQFMLNTLAEVRENAGITIAEFAAMIGRQPQSSSNRQHTAWIYGLLRDLERRGLVKRMDDQKPIVWQLALEPIHAD